MTYKVGMPSSNINNNSKKSRSAYYVQVLAGKEGE